MQRVRTPILLALSLSVFLVLGLGGCGQKGALYLPEEELRKEQSDNE